MFRRYASTRAASLTVRVLFDSCWDPYPKLGPQHPPIPGVHNSGWVQSPGAKALSDPAQYGRLKTYVQGVVGAFANDSRVLAWDVWNEPNNGNGAYGKVELENKIDYLNRLLPQVFEWARAANPTQPLTSGVWEGDWSSSEKLSVTAHIQLDQSDVISFHNYSWPEDFEQRIQWLEKYHRPLFCTEYMARPMGSTFDAILPIAKKHHAAAINWGLVAGQDADVSPMGFVAEAIRARAACSMVSRGISRRWNTIPRAGSGDHSRAYRQEEWFRSAS